MDYYAEIKEQLVNNEIIKKVKDYSKNRSDLTTYYNIGKLLSKADKQYGKGIIKEYSLKLTEEFGKNIQLHFFIKLNSSIIFIKKSRHCREI